MAHSLNVRLGHRFDRLNAVVQTFERRALQLLETSRNEVGTLESTPAFKESGSSVTTSELAAPAILRLATSAASA